MLSLLSSLATLAGLLYFPIIARANLVPNRCAPVLVAPPESKMIKLKSILQFRELPCRYHLTRQHLPSIREFIDPTEQDNEQNICDYLYSGVMIEPMGGGETCFDIVTPGVRIGKIVPGEYVPGQPFLNPGQILTDGIWYWNGFHLYYVKHYHLRLRLDFVLHAKYNCWQLHTESIDVSRIDFYDLRRNIAEGVEN